MGLRKDSLNHVDSLNVIDVASPCPADWDDMAGDDRMRHCSHCKLNVYNLSEMTSDEALRLVNAREGRKCVRFFRRADGTMITRDCPVGLRTIRKAVRRKIARMWAGAAALAGTVFFGGIFSRSAKAQEVGPPPARHGAAMGLMAPVEFKGDVCIRPQVPVEIFVAQQSPEGLVKLIRSVRTNIGCRTLGQPDPDDRSAMSERDRQAVEAQLNDPSWTAPAAGGKEHQRLIKYLGELVKRYPQVQSMLPVPEALRTREVLGAIKIPEADLPSDVQKKLEQALSKVHAVDKVQ